MADELQKHFISTLFKIKKLEIYDKSECALSLGEIIILDRLLKNNQYHNECTNVAELQKNLHISKPAVSQILNSLEHKGYIERQIYQKDRRRFIIITTPKANDVLNRSEKALEDTIEVIFEEYGKENMAMLLDQMASLCEAYEKIYEKKKKERSV